VRAGHHCAEPLHRSLGVAHSLRASTSIYTSEGDVDRFFEVMDSILLDKHIDSSYT
jgi:cysteine desulfurase / selenocysteine lyase